MFKIILFALLCSNVDSLPYHYAKNRQRVSRGHNNSRLSPSISLGLNEAAFSKYREDSQVKIKSVEKRGRKSCSEAWYLCIFKAVQAVDAIAMVHKYCVHSCKYYPVLYILLNLTLTHQ